MMNRKPYIIILLALFCLPCTALCQDIPIRARQLSLSIKDFHETDRLLLNNQFAVKAGIVPPINLSKAPLELRIYRYTFGAGTLQLIAIEQDTIKASMYYWHDLSSRKDFISSAASMYRYSLSLKGAPLHLTGDQTWQGFFNQLNSNHLFSIPGQNLLSAEVLRMNAGTVIAGADMSGSMAIEVKVNDSFRVVDYNQRYDPEPTGLADYNFLIALNTLFNNLKP